MGDPVSVEYPLASHWGEGGRRRPLATPLPQGGCRESTSDSHPPPPPPTPAHVIWHVAPTRARTRTEPTESIPEEELRHLVSRPDLNPLIPLDVFRASLRRAGVDMSDAEVDQVPHVRWGAVAGGPGTAPCLSLRKWLGSHADGGIAPAASRHTGTTTCSGVAALWACQVFTSGGGGGGVNRAPQNLGGGVREKGSIDRHQ